MRKRRRGRRMGGFGRLAVGPLRTTEAEAGIRRLELSGAWGESHL